MPLIQRRIAQAIIVSCILFFALNLLAFLRLEQSVSQDLPLRQRVDSHEKQDDERFSTSSNRIGKLETTAGENQQRISKLEEAHRALTERLNDVVWWLRAVFGAIASQLLGFAFWFLKYVRGPTSGKRG